MRVIWSIAVALALAASAADAWNFTLGVKKDDRRVIDVGSFGFIDGGVMEFSVESLEVPPDQSGKIGFTLDLVATAAGARQERATAGEEAKKNEVCFVDDETFIGKRPRFHIALQNAIGETNPLKNARVQINVTTPGLYAFFFYNCRSMDQQSKVSFRIHAKQYNRYLAGDGSTRISYLSAGDENLPGMYVVFALFFLAGAVSWHRTLAENPRRVFAVHKMMYGLVVVKIIALLLEAAVLHHRKATGGLKYGLDYIYYAFQTIRGVMLFTVILLLGTGWSTLKPFLGERDKKILYVILPLQVGVNIALAVLEESSEGNKSWIRWREALRMFDIVCCCAILLPLVWSIKTLKDAEATSGKKARNLGRLEQFRTFYIAVIAFVYFTRIVVPMAETQVPFQLTWIPPFLYEASAVFFYAFCAVRFRPMDAETLVTPAAEDDAGEVDLDDV